MTFEEMQVKWSVTLTDRLGPEMLTVLEIKGQVLHRVRLHVKVPGLLLNLNALLTKKLPKFLSRLNEMSSGKENMCLVSGSLLRILKFLRMTFLIASANTYETRNKTTQMRPNQSRAISIFLTTPTTTWLFAGFTYTTGTQKAAKISNKN